MTRPAVVTPGSGTDVTIAIIIPAAIDAAEIDAALNRVIDPCSAALGDPLGLAEMGLIDGVAIDDAGVVHATLRLTSPCCAYGPTLAAAAVRELEGLRGVSRAVVEIDHGAVWTPAEISSVALSRLDSRRRRTSEITGVRPYDWSSP